MTNLYFKNQFRTESDESIIQNLLRKGWIMVAPEPDYDHNTQTIKFDYENNQWQIITLPPEDIAFFEDSQKQIQKINNFQNAIYNGFQVNPEGFVLGLQESDRNAFSQMLGLVKEALELSLITNDTPQTIADKNGNKHIISTLRFRQIMVQYGFYFKTLWDQLNS